MPKDKKQGPGIKMTICLQPVEASCFVWKDRMVVTSRRRHPAQISDTASSSGRPDSPGHGEDRFFLKMRFRSGRFIYAADEADRTTCRSISVFIIPVLFQKERFWLEMEMFRPVRFKPWGDIE